VAKAWPFATAMIGFFIFLAAVAAKKIRLGWFLRLRRKNEGRDILRLAPQNTSAFLYFWQRLLPKR
jgi:hypothetical protein